MDNAAQGSHSELGLPVVPFLARPKPKIPFHARSFFAPKPNANACYAGTGHRTSSTSLRHNLGKNFFFYTSHLYQTYPYLLLVGIQSYHFTLPIEQHWRKYRMIKKKNVKRVH